MFFSFSSSFIHQIFTVIYKGHWACEESGREKVRFIPQVDFHMVMLLKYCKIRAWNKKVSKSFREIDFIRPSTIF